jgi:hypothetical protein
VSTAFEKRLAALEAKLSGSTYVAVPSPAEHPRF